MLSIFALWVCARLMVVKAVSRREMKRNETRSLKLHLEMTYFELVIYQTTVFRVHNDWKRTEKKSIAISRWITLQHFTWIRKKEGKKRINWTWTMLRDNGYASSHKYVWLLPYRCRAQEMHGKNIIKFFFGDFQRLLKLPFGA